MAITNSVTTDRKIIASANLAAAGATCRLAAAARRSQARRGGQPTQDAGLHPRPRLCPAHGRLSVLHSDDGPFIPFAEAQHVRSALG